LRKKTDAIRIINEKAQVSRAFSIYISLELIGTKKTSKLFTAKNQI
jgi:hypothetical protein